MASIRRKDHCKSYFACFTLPGGRRVQRSTGESDRKKAQRIADAFEEAARTRRTARQVQRVISDLYAQITGESLPSSSVRGYFQSWLDRKKPETSPTTFTFYNAKAARFLNWLGERADGELSAISTNDIHAYRTKESERVSAATVNHEIKFLRMVFEQARRDSFLSDNPAAGVKVLKRNERRARRAFTLSELGRLIDSADAEWRSLIAFGLYTGQRLGDLARLTWANIDLERSELRLVTSKTARQQIIPLAAPLRLHIEGLDASDDPKQPIHPRAWASLEKCGKVGTLSRQFYELMADAGLAPVKKHRRAKDGAGRNGRREISEISFHALRHTATSLMKNGGISPAIVQDIIGHESAAISANYTHIEDEAKRNALNAIPDVLSTRDTTTSSAG